MFLTNIYSRKRSANNSLFTDVLHPLSSFFGELIYMKNDIKYIDWEISSHFGNRSLWLCDKFTVIQTYKTEKHKTATDIWNQCNLNTYIIWR